jgi:glycerate-2-kinase
MNAGTSIDALNCVRKHLSAIKGGRLGAAAGPSLTLAISDVHHPVEDDASVIGSGPTVPDATTFAGALEVVTGIRGIPTAVRRHLERGAAGLLAETVKPDDPRLARAAFHVIGNRRTALAGAAGCARERGYHVIVLDEAIGGEARTASRHFIESARSAAPASRPACVLAAGETTVSLTGRSRRFRDGQARCQSEAGPGSSAREQRCLPVLRRAGRSDILRTHGNQRRRCPDLARGVAPRYRQQFSQLPELPATQECRS